MSLYSTIESSRDGKFKVLGEKIISDFDASFSDFCTSYGREDSEHPDNKISEEVNILVREFLTGVFRNLQNIIESFQPHLKNENLSKVEKIDLCCLILGTYELKYRDTPKKVAIKETLNIGQKYGGATTPQFLNAVLDKIK